MHQGYREDGAGAAANDGPGLQQHQRRRYQQNLVYNKLVTSTELPARAGTGEILVAVRGRGRHGPFELQTGVTFHDGSAFTAADVVYTFQRLLDPPQVRPARGCWAPRSGGHRGGG